jgi:hypothetical protein
MLNAKLQEKIICPSTRHSSLESNAAVGTPKSEVTEPFSPK